MVPQVYIWTLITSILNILCDFIPMMFLLVVFKLNIVSRNDSAQAIKKLLVSEKSTFIEDYDKNDNRISMAESM